LNTASQGISSKKHFIFCRECFRRFCRLYQGYVGPHKQQHRRPCFIPSI